MGQWKTDNADHVGEGPWKVNFDLEIEDRTSERELASPAKE